MGDIRHSSSCRMTSSASSKQASAASAEERANGNSGASVAGSGRRAIAGVQQGGLFAQQCGGGRGLSDLMPRCYPDGVALVGAILVRRRVGERFVRRGP